MTKKAIRRGKGTKIGKKIAPQGTGMTPPKHSKKDQGLSMAKRERPPASPTKKNEQKGPAEIQVFKPTDKRGPDERFRRIMLRKGKKSRR